MILTAFGTSICSDREEFSTKYTAWPKCEKRSQRNETFTSFYRDT